MEEAYQQYIESMMLVDISHQYVFNIDSKVITWFDLIEWIKLTNFMF